MLLLARFKDDELAVEEDNGVEKVLDHLNADRYVCSPNFRKVRTRINQRTCPPCLL